jgi:ATP-dependent protease ClpP protease subunit
MSIISINGFGDTDLLQKFVKEWNDSEKTSQKKKDIYIDSIGGNISVFQTIQHMIESCQDKCTLTAVGEIHSSAFELFFSVKCERKIVPFTFGMYHFGFDEITIDEKGKAKEEYGKARLNNLKLMHTYTLLFCKKVGMNSTEINSIKSGKDVYFQYKRLNEFLKNTRS